MHSLTHTQRRVSGPLSRHTAARMVTVDPESWVTGEGNIQSSIPEKHTAIFQVPETIAAFISNA